MPAIDRENYANI
jgi:transcription initiation factor TFIIIB Brf1 subunit/transcription initiation factor TFIIB